MTSNSKTSKQGRPRDTSLPDYVYFKKGRYVFVPYLGRGNRAKEIPLKIDGQLLREEATPAQVWRAYDSLAANDDKSLKWLLQQFLKSKQAQRLKPTTRSGYELYLSVICNKKLKGGTLFGELPYSAMTIKTVRRYLDSRTAEIGGNREVQFMKSAFSWAMQYVDDVTANPCVGVTLNPETPRQRYVTHDEYELVYDIAKNSAYPHFAPAMELAYLCRARRGEVFSLKKDTLIDDGIYLERGKGSCSEITLWTQRLKNAVKATEAINKQAPTPISGAYLLHDKKGLKFTKNALDTGWQRIIAKALVSGLQDNFTFHDLKAKGISDHEHKHGGHRSGKMKLVYDRLPDLVKATK